MARIVERVFDPNRPLIVRRFFAGAGRHWNPGDEFPWRRLAVDLRRVRLLFEAGKLMHPDESLSKTPDLVGLQAADQSAYTQIPSIAQEIQDEDIHHAAVTAGEQPAPVEQATDELDDLGMKELRAIAEAEGAPTRVSREAQREAIRENRRAAKSGA